MEIDGNASVEADMEFIDLKEQFRRLEPQIRARMDSVLAHGQFIMGAEIEELEKRLAEFAGVKHCISCSSGTMALELLFWALGIGPGDAVFTTPLTFVATAETIARTGATPIFVDIASDYNLNATQLDRAILAVRAGDEKIHPLPEAARARKLLPRAIVPVDLFGTPACYDEILDVARRHELEVIEDAAQGLGGSYKGRPLCGCGCHAAATSFFPAKPLGCYGDGGAVFTDDDNLAKLVDSLRYHGRIGPKDKNDNVRLGTNGRMDTLQAAVVLAKLDAFEDEIAARQVVAERYALLLQNIPEVLAPQPPVDGVSTWAQYTVLLPEGTDRKRVMAEMKADGIPTAINYPKSLHMQKAFAYLKYAENDFPVVQKITQRVLSLPMHPYLERSQQECVVDALRRALIG